MLTIKNKVDLIIEFFVVCLFLAINVQLYISGKFVHYSDFNLFIIFVILSVVSSLFFIIDIFTIIMWDNIKVYYKHIYLSDIGMYKESEDK